MNTTAAIAYWSTVLISAGLVTYLTKDYTIGALTGCLVGSVLIYMGAMFNDLVAILEKRH